MYPNLFRQNSPKNNVIILLFWLLCFFSAANAQAACVYDKNVQGQDLQVGIMLSWTTASEENNAVFLIEKSDNGTDFVDIGSVPAAGTSQTSKDYSFLDVTANGKRLYYRLKQVDHDGSFSFSDIVAVTKAIPNNFMVARMSAAAASKTFTVTLDALKQGILTFELRDLKGSVWHRGILPLVNGLNELKIDLSAVKPNFYKLVLNLDKEEETLVIQRTLDEIERKPNVASNKKSVKSDKQ